MADPLFRGIYKRIGSIDIPAQLKKYQMKEIGDSYNVQKIMTELNPPAKRHIQRERIAKFKDKLAT